MITWTEMLFAILFAVGIVFGITLLLDFDRKRLMDKLMLFACIIAFSILSAGVFINFIYLEKEIKIYNNVKYKILCDERNYKYFQIETEDNSYLVREIGLNVQASEKENKLKVISRKQRIKFLNIPKNKEYILYVK